eukprot:4824899-Alexandrium_andersonii.AAC.1
MEVELDARGSNQSPSRSPWGSVGRRKSIIVIIITIIIIIIITRPLNLNDTDCKCITIGVCKGLVELAQSTVHQRQ